MGVIAMLVSGGLLCMGRIAVHTGLLCIGGGREQGSRG